MNESLTLERIAKMDDVEANVVFAKIRWPETGGEPVCPRCGACNPYKTERSSGWPRFICRCCSKDFSLTSGTIFGSRKLSLQAYLSLIVTLLSVSGNKTVLSVSNDLNTQYKTCWVLISKLRDAIRQLHEQNKQVSAESVIHFAITQPPSERLVGYWQKRAKRL